MSRSVHWRDGVRQEAREVVGEVRWRANSKSSHGTASAAWPGDLGAQFGKCTQIKRKILRRGKVNLTERFFGLSAQPEA